MSPDPSSGGTGGEGCWGYDASRFGAGAYEAWRANARGNWHLDSRYGSPRPMEGDGLTTQKIWK
jgi:hypothetical protein